MNKHRITAAALAVIISLGLTAGSVSAEGEEGTMINSGSGTGHEPASVSEQALDSRIARNYLTLATVGSKSVSSHKRIAVKLWGSRLSVGGLRIGEVTYIPFRAAANMLGASYSYNSSAATSTMRVGGLTLTATAGCYVSYANGRTLFSMSPTVIMSDGRMYIPASVFAKATGLLTAESDGLLTLGGTLSPLISADRFYRDDEVFWLARIIHAESAGEPLLGQIAVGDVVLNRVRSSEYPNTIYGVIFDRKYGVQFSPILNGSIYNTPSYSATLAAKICLEGVDVTDGVMFFLQPQLAASSWIPRTREYSFTVGRHDFYR